MELLDTQVVLVSRKLDAVGLAYQPLKEELLDHICCAIEAQLDQGMAFEQAFEEAFDTFGEDEMQEIEKQTIQLIHQKKLIMKKVSFLTLFLLLSVTTIIWGSRQDPPWGSPISGDFEVSSGFGYRMHPKLKVKKMHMGIDIKAGIGTEVKATADGVVLKALTSSGGYGTHVVIQHDDHYQTLYSQLSTDLKVKVGDKVKAGDVIGVIGTPHFATGPHLHYEVIKDGANEDPASYLGL
ncbi:MAG: M23 family metallopeptidase [Phaeodactylibacter sp.]|nr:M23 family metallopeptidase [Phaeodactylibacter sp.]